MIKTSAVICELNPAHEGHKYVFEHAKEQGGAVVAVMSGNFVQRGENAIYDKYKRAEAALDIGADLVLELPFPWSCSSAQYFATASVYIAESIGAHRLFFGSECGDPAALSRAAEITSGEEFNRALPADVRAAEHREKMLRAIAPDLPEGLLSSANDILGIEYIKNLKNAVPVPVKRISAESASFLRENMAENKEKYPDAVYFERLAELEFLRLRCEADPVFDTAEASGGVGERLYKAAFSAKNGREMFEIASTKQYTNARLKRAALYHMMDVKKYDIEALPRFSAVLAFNVTGQKLLANLRKKSRIPLVTKPSSVKYLPIDAARQAQKSLFADSIYALLEGKSSDRFIKASPIVISTGPKKS